MPLEEYRKRRDFGRTAEPSGDEARGTGRRFVVQKHAARRPHYDFRLELDGVLKSWAIPKGPSVDPGEKRLAVQVEDHPLAYAEFEGVIPAGEYGAGSVILWDRGTWEPLGDAARDYDKGHLRFRLAGARLRGEWHLVRMGGKAAREGRGNWLLIKDAGDTVSGREPEDEFPNSVASGRALGEVAEHPHATWNHAIGDALAGTPARPMPRLPQPQLASAVPGPPRGAGWLHEIKLDGYRMLARIDGGAARLYSRNGREWSAKLPDVVAALAALPLRRAWLDGELAVVQADGRTSFQALQNSLGGEGDGTPLYFAFDLLYLDGHDLTGLPLVRRKGILADLLRGAAASPRLRYSDHVAGRGDRFFDQSCALGLEGSIAKRADRPYRGGRGRDWLKVKCDRRQELVIGGWTRPAGKRSHFGALLVGYWRDGQLCYAGKVGTGFSEATLRGLMRRMAPLARAAPPFTALPPAVRRGAHWIEPQLIAEVAFSEWTRDGILRQARFEGLREDKSAGEVGRDASPPGRQRTGSGSARRRTAYPGLSSPDKVLYPLHGLTKRDLADYYVQVAGRMLPELRGRPLTLLRCPNGYDAGCFFQRHAGDGTPPALARVAVPEKDKTRDYVRADDLPGLLALVQLGVLEIHAWGARHDRLERPDRLVFDLDPDTGLGWERVVSAARRLRDLLDDLGLVSFVRSTSGKGLHLVVPLQRRHGWDEAKAFSRDVARALAHAHPGDYTVSPNKAARRGKLFVDYLRNGRGASAVASYSSRARPGAPVATPLHWDELELDPHRLTVASVPARLTAADPWAALPTLRQSLTRRVHVRLRDHL